MGSKQGRGRPSKNPLGSNTSVIGIKVPYAAEEALAMVFGSKEGVGYAIRRYVYLSIYPVLYSALSDLEGEEKEKMAEFLNEQIVLALSDLESLKEAYEPIPAISKKIEELVISIGEESYVA